jgi:CBS domain-containing protein
VVERLVGAGVSGLPVVDDRGALVGIITEADLSPRRRVQGTVRGRSACSRSGSRARAPLGHQGAGWKAADVMTANVETCAPDDEVRSAARHQARTVKDGDRIVGVVSERDVLGAFVKQIQDQRSSDR